MPDMCSEWPDDVGDAREGVPKMQLSRRLVCSEAGYGLQGRNSG